MPELPEVETIKRQLIKSLVGKRIKSVDVLTPRFVNIPTKNFKKIVVDTKIMNTRRHAKLLIIDLANGYSLLIHLKMTGQLIYGSSTSIISKFPGRLPNRHTHIIYVLNDGSRLFHKDIRKFGWVKLIKTNELEKYLQKEKYGPEPLSDNFSFTAFRKILNAKPRQRIKQFLMEQKNIAGIGNLYADEICFCAGIKPTRTNKKLSKKEIINIYKCTKNILTEAIKYRGSSVDNYLDTTGEAGNYTQRLKVYGREGKRCFRCSGIVKKIKLSGRGTHFCPACQK